MQIVVTIPDEVAARVVSRGMTPEGYVESLIAEKAGLPKLARDLTLEELNEVLDALAEHSDKVPNLPPEAYTRESIYQDHD